jgi:hypothetical protein
LLEIASMILWLNQVQKKLEMVGIEPKDIEQSKPVQDLNRIIFPALYWPKVK